MYDNDFRPCPGRQHVVLVGPGSVDCLHLVAEQRQRGARTAGALPQPERRLAAWVQEPVLSTSVDRATDSELRVQDQPRLGPQDAVVQADLHRRPDPVVPDVYEPLDKGQIAPMTASRRAKTSIVVAIPRTPACSPSHPSHP